MLEKMNMSKQGNMTLSQVKKQDTQNAGTPKTQKQKHLETNKRKNLEMLKKINMPKQSNMELSKVENKQMGEEEYTGTVNANGQPHGTGILTYSDGDKYEGTWENGVIKGERTITYNVYGTRKVEHTIQLPDQQPSYEDGIALLKKVNEK